MADADRTIDVREIDGPPFGPITDALEALEAGERLRVVSDFEPEPLYGVLESRGFAYEAERDGGTWEITVRHA